MESDDPGVGVINCQGLTRDLGQRRIVGRGSWNTALLDGGFQDNVQITVHFLFSPSFQDCRPARFLLGPNGHRLVGADTRFRVGGGGGVFWAWLVSDRTGVEQM